MKKSLFLIVALSFLGLMQPEMIHAQTESTYEAMEGVTSVKTVFDFRIGEPDKAMVHLDLIHGMVEDPNLVKEGEQPEIIIVLIGPSVNLVSTDNMKNTSGSQNEIAEKISAMNSDGIRFEICMAAAHLLNVSADSILPEVVQVENGWISLIGYQQNGYSMIADF